MSDAPAVAADILNMNPGPALSATSDMPAVGEVAPPVDNGAADAPTPAAEGGTPSAEAPAAEGEGSEDGAAGEGEAAEPAVDGTEPKEPAAPKPKGGINERFSTLAEARKAAEARATAAEARAERLERIAEEALARIPKEPAQVAPDPPPPEPRPLRETFDTPDAYEDALIEWSTKRAIAVTRAEQDHHAKAEREASERTAAETSQQQSFRAIQESHAARVEAKRAERPDYADVAERDDLRISLPMAMAIMQSEDGPDAALYLGEHPEIAERISAMVLPGQVFPPGHQFAGMPVPDVQKQLLEMGRVFAAVTQPAAPARRDPPAPPAPITPLRRGGGPAVPRTLEELGNEGSMEDYAARRMPEVQAERRPGVFGGGVKPH